MLFLLVMEALSGLIRRADAWGLLQPLPSRLIPYRTSLNVDNLVLFLILVDTDLWITKCILSMFEKVSVLGCNLGKCHIDPTKCEDSQVQLVQDLFPCPVTAFLMKYLGLPLSVSKLPKSANRLPMWEGRLMQCSGCLPLINSTLAAIPVYTAMSQELPT
jgi:hypothetical protein